MLHPRVGLDIEPSRCEHLQRKGEGLDCYLDNAYEYYVIHMHMQACENTLSWYCIRVLLT